MRALKVETDQRCDEVSKSEEIEATGEDGACDAVEGRKVPGQLRAVDGQMWSNGSIQALFGENLVAVGRFGGGGVDGRRGAGLEGGVPVMGDNSSYQPPMLFLTISLHPSDAVATSHEVRAHRFCSLDWLDDKMAGVDDRMRRGWRESTVDVSLVFDAWEQDFWRMTYAAWRAAGPIFVPAYCDSRRCSIGRR